MRPYALCGICYRSVTVRHKPVFYRNVCFDRPRVRHSVYSTLCYNRIRLSPKLRLLPTRTLLQSQTLNLADFSFFVMACFTMALWHWHVGGCKLSAVNLGRSSQVYYSERPPLFTTH